MAWTPFRDYTGYQHILLAGANFCHPLNGNVYFTACEQLAGARQNLSVYRIKGGTTTVELVKCYQGTVDSAAHITWGSVVIGLGGALWVATSLIIPGAQKITGTGFQGCLLREPEIDEPYGLRPILARLAHIEAVLGNLASTGGLDAKQTEALNRLVELCRL
jgi:hypothetical protein